LFVAAVIALRTLGFSWAGVGINLRALPLQFLVGLTGLVFGYVEYQILEPEPLAKAFTWEQLWVPVLILLFSTGFVEEVIFRGVMQRAATEALGRFGVLYVAILFTTLHVGYKSLLDVLFVFGVALFFGWAVAKTRSILGVTLSHGLINIVLFLVVPLLPVFNPPPPPLALGTPLPPLMTSTPTVTVSATPTASVPTPTPTLSPPTATPTLTPTATATLSPIAMALTPTPTLTSTATIRRPTVPLTPSSSAEIVVDDQDNGFSRHGQFWWREPIGYQGSMLWTFVNGDVVECWAEWSPLLPQCGTYDVFVFIPARFAFTTSALYKIHHKGGMATVGLNQQEYFDEWVSLGSYEFDAGSDGYVRLTDATGESADTNRYVGFDAIRWVFIAPCSGTAQ
jgi:membrane protease YdiL (CAAX protease family)